MQKKNIYLCQVNSRFDDQVFLPYSVGMIQAYCQKFEEIKNNFNFKGFIFLREKIENVIQKLEFPSIFGVSCYIWNWEYSKALAQNVKFVFPECLIVMGGPQVPENSETFFLHHPYVDILVHHEGEIAFSEILREHVNENPDYTRIASLSIRVNNNISFKTKIGERTRDTNELPSPYLNGVFDELVLLPYKWNACHETNRGCPYSCTFCDWGSAVYTKLRMFDVDRLESELEWFGENKIEIIYNCDANYGILERDYYLIQRLVSVRKQHGYPRQFRTAFAKTNPANIYRIAKLLQEVNMQKGITLSAQSMDPTTLQNVKRKNLRNDQLLSLFNLYRIDKIPTYTELIIGLPGETNTSFKKGVNLLLELGQHDGLFIYLCMVLPNSEMANIEYSGKFGIKTRRFPLILAYASPNTDGITEFHDIVTETNDMSLNDWKKRVIFSWVVQSFHCLNLTQYLAVYLRTSHDITYDYFYEKLLHYAELNPNTIIGKQFHFIDDLVNKGLVGNTMTVVLPEYGEITWFPEEATFLNMVAQKDLLYLEIESFFINLLLSEMISLQKDLIDDLVGYQKAILLDPYSPPEFSIRTQYNWPGYFNKAYLGSKSIPEKQSTQVLFSKDSDYRENPRKYALDIIRFGRKSGKLHHKLITVTVNQALVSF